MDRSALGLEDFSESSLAGRLGEAVAYLTMVKWGYVYWDRVAVLWERAARKSEMSHPEQLTRATATCRTVGMARPALAPDFAFEKALGDVALMEAKGSLPRQSRVWF